MVKTSLYGKKEGLPRISCGFTRPRSLRSHSHNRSRRRRILRLLQ